MTEIVPNPLANELNIFKEDILKSVRELENKLTTQITNKESALNNDYEKFVSKINLLLNNNKDMISTIIAQKLKLEKISELESFKNKVDSMLITHEIRIKNSLDEIDRVKTRYDKILSENLYVSGYIGNACQFRTLSDYISYNIAEVSKLKNEKEQLKREMKDIKAKFDGLMKTMITMNDNTVKLCNNYTDNKQQYFRNLLDDAKAELNQKSLDMRVMTQKFQNDQEIKMNNIMEIANKLEKSETNMNNLINDNFYICEKQHEEIKNNINDGNNKIDKNKKNINILEDRFENLQSKIKQIDNLGIRVSKLFDMVKNTSSTHSAFKKNINNNNTNTNNNIDISRSVVSPPPKKMKRKGSNPDLIKLNTETTSTMKTSAPNKLLKSVRFPVVKKLNINTSTNVTNSIDEANRQRKKDRVTEVKFNIVDESTNTNQEKSKKNIINNSIKEKEEEKDEEEKFKEKEKEIDKFFAKEENKDNEKEREKLDENEINKEKEKSNIPRAKNANITNTIQTLPILTINGNRNSKNLIIKPIESENYKIDNSRHNNNLLTMMNSNTQTTYSTLSKMKKIGLDFGKENPGCKMVSLKLSPDSTKEGKSKRPPKPQYDIVNSLINDYKAKLFSKMHTPEQVDDINNELLEMPKRVSQAFGRTTYTFFLNKDNLGKKGNNNIIKNGLKTGNDNKVKK